MNVAPGPDGSWHDEAYALLSEIGDWMEVNSDAIYNTRPLAPYKEGSVCLTQGKDGNINIIYLGSEKEAAPPAIIGMTGWCPPEGSKITAPGYDGPIPWEKNGEGFIIHTPEKLQKKPACNYAWVFKVH